MNLEIIYEDEDIVVCHKPAGIATETRRIGQQDMVSLLRNYRAEKGESAYIGMVHRLDQPVEGLLVFGKSQAAAAGLSKQVLGHGFGKHYYAVAQKTAENSAAAQAALTDYILFDKKRNVSCIVPQGTPQAKRAVLDYRVIGEEGERICFDITLHTGRHHQIRLQMAHHGFPLIGDSKYGPVRGQEKQLALCAYRLTFLHPATKKEMDFMIRPHNEAILAFLEPESRIARHS